MRSLHCGRFAPKPCKEKWSSFKKFWFFDKFCLERCRNEFCFNSWGEQLCVFNVNKRRTLYLISKILRKILVFLKFKTNSKLTWAFILNKGHVIQGHIPPTKGGTCKDSSEETRKHLAEKMLENWRIYFLNPEIIFVFWKSKDWVYTWNWSFMLIKVTKERPIVLLI